ncbi:11446_t:CDS:1 [Funneliformis caledonium]|uniref:11446_t:CDS:1 n=1 Tax=Funneliformis caledonium TaxID=1117310 RepID=A0A9N9BE50_9GLOM|nr:11446_t:CDS:1 [Funneliformis caledonium]
MPFRLPIDCIDDIFENLDKRSLHSCLLVSRFWSEVSVRILWRDFLNYYPKFRFSSRYLSILVACLPKESKDLLHEKNILIPTPTSKPPRFNYLSYCKILSIKSLDQLLIDVLSSPSQGTLQQEQDLINNIRLVSQEILKEFFKQTFHIKELTYCGSSMGGEKYISNIAFPEAMDRLTDLSILSCNSGIPSEFFYQLTQVCSTIQSLEISLEKSISGGLKELIIAQRNLKSFTIRNNTEANVEILIPSLAKHSNTIIKLNIYEAYVSYPMSSIAAFTNLQELTVLRIGTPTVLPDVTYPRLQSLNLDGCNLPSTKFLENNGKNLQFLHTYESDESLILAIARFCPNLRSIYARFRSNPTGLESLKTLLINCQQLEEIIVYCGGDYLNEDDLLDYFASYSSKNVYRLHVRYEGELRSELSPAVLERFFTTWTNRMPQKSLSLITEGFHCSHKRTMVIKRDTLQVFMKYSKLGVIDVHRSL